MSFYTPFFYFARGVIRLIHPKYQFIREDSIVRPAVLLCRHKNSLGPVTIMETAKQPIRMWVLDKLTDRQLCYQHFNEYTYTKRYGWSPFISKFIASITSYVVVKTTKSCGSIPVYRGNREIMKTFNLTVEALERGDIVCLVPDVDYARTEGDTAALYDGFLHIGKIYHRKTGQSVNFYPIYTSEQARQILVGKPLSINSTRPFHMEKERIIAELKLRMDSLAIEAGDLPDDFLEKEASR